MKRSEIYLAAAKSVDRSDDFSCNVISCSSGDPNRKAYAEMFGLKSHRGEDYATRNALTLWNCQDHHQMRVLMLCLAAAIAESEGD